VSDLEQEQARDDLKQIQALSFQEILNTLLQKDENLPLKSHIDKPSQLIKLNVLADFFASLELDDCAILLYNYVDTFLTYMVSYKRESRKEVIKALTSNITVEQNSMNDNNLGMR